MNSLLDIIDHFDALASAAPGISDFVYGDADAVVERTRMKISYPCMWLETPDVDLNSAEDSATIRYSCTVYIIDKVSRKTRREEREIMSNLLNQSVQLVLRVRKDARRNRSWWLDEQSTKRVQLSPKLVGTEVDAGWACEFTIVTPAPCLDELAMPARP